MKQNKRLPFFLIFFIFLIIFWVEVQIWRPLFFSIFLIFLFFYFFIFLFF